MTSKRKVLIIAIIDIVVKICLYAFILSRLSTSDIFIVFAALFFSYSLSLFVKPFVTKMFDEEMDRLQKMLDQIKTYKKDDTEND